MVTFQQRVGAAYKAFTMPSSQSHTEKSFGWNGEYTNSYWALTGDGELRRNEYGIAAAYSVNVAVQQGLQVWQNWLDGLKWEVRDTSNNAILVDSTMRRVPDGIAGARFFNAVKAHDKFLHHGYMKSLAYSDQLYSESYIRLVRDKKTFYPKGLQWLNPLYTEPQIMRGAIDYYNYSGEHLYNKFEPREIAYRILLRDPDNDLRGQSRVLTAIDAAALEQNTKRALRAFFQNGMVLGAIISPINENTNLAPSQIKQTEDQMAKLFKGVGNFFKTAILPTKSNIQFPPAPDIEKNYGIIEPLRNEILMAMGVPPQLANDPSQVSYDNADDLKRQWWQAWAMPYAKDIEEFHNAEILPFLEYDHDCYFTFDYTPYEVEKPEVVSQDLNAGVIDIYTAQKLRGIEPDNDLKDIRIINGVPMSKAVIIKLANNIPSQMVTDYAQADKLQAEATTTQTNVNPDMPSNQAALSSKSHHHHHHHDDLPSIKAFEPNHDSALDELKAWHKFNKANKSRSFTPIWLVGNIADNLNEAITHQDDALIKAAFDEAFDHLGNVAKAIQATRLDFENDFDELLSRARREKMGRVQWASAMRSIIRRYGTRAYVDGLRDGGVEDDPSEDDLVMINSLISQNSQYVTELGNVLYKEDGISNEQADVKAAMWFSKTINPFYQEGVFSADANGLYEWVRKMGKDSCTDCIAMDGQRHRLKWFKARKMPKSDDLECKGFECECQLVKSRGRSRG